MMTGLIIAAYSIFEDLCEVLFGYVMDVKHSRRKFLMFGLVGDAVAMLLYSLAKLPIHLLMVRVWHGISGSVAGPSIMSMTADVPHPLAKLGARMGLYGTTIILSVMIGWALGGVAVSILGYSRFFQIIFILLIAGSALTLIIKEPKPLIILEEADGGGRMSVADAVGRLRTILSSPEYLMACIGIFTHMMTMGAITTLLPRFVKEGLGLTSLHVAIPLIAYGLATLFLQVPMGHLIERVGRERMLMIGFALGSICMVMLGLVAIYYATIAVMVAYGVAYSFLFPTLSSMAIQYSPARYRSLASGVFHISFTEGVVLGALSFAAVAHFLGLQAGLAASSAAPLLALLSIKLLRRKSR